MARKCQVILVPAITILGRGNNRKNDFLPPINPNIYNGLQGVFFLNGSLGEFGDNVTQCSYQGNDDSSTGSDDGCL